MIEQLTIQQIEKTKEKIKNIEGDCNIFYYKTGELMSIITHITNVKITKKGLIINNYSISKFKIFIHDKNIINLFGGIKTTTKK